MALFFFFFLYAIVERRGFRCNAIRDSLLHEAYDPEIYLLRLCIGEWDHLAQ